MSKKAFDSGQLASCRCRWPVARAAAPRRRRAPCVCFVASPATQPGLAAIDVPAQTIPTDVTTASVPEHISVSSLLEVVSDDLLNINSNLKSPLDLSHMMPSRRSSSFAEW
ncbi:unnamed protein product [Urochloa humidicola]